MMECRCNWKILRLSFKTEGNSLLDFPDGDDFRSNKLYDDRGYVQVSDSINDEFRISHLWLRL